MQVRYRYRIEPTEVQRAMLARTFGCVRVVFNDALRCRDEAFRAGEKLTPAEVQRRVITEAKTIESRAWLSEVASVALVQAVRDAHRAFSNFFDSVRGRRRGRAIHDAGWRQFVRLLREKAEKYCRTVHTVDRWLPSSKTCSACGHVMDEMPLKTREWCCPACRSRHDRDHNAAINILAAGRAERLNAGGARVSPSLGEARGEEAGSISGAASRVGVPGFQPGQHVNTLARP